jgi:putative ATP-dependent endonuclease of OLD family
MATVRKLVLKNFRRFRTLQLEFDPEVNILVGGNEAGKSSVLQALDIVLSASRNKVEAIGLEALFNVECVAEFRAGDRKVKNLPELIVEVYLEGVEDQYELDGRNNTKRAFHHGMKMECKPIDEYTETIQSVLADKDSGFPFEYYDVRFLTFTNNPVISRERPLKHIVIDSSQINNEYATREYTRSIYLATASVAQRHWHSLKYRNSKLQFKNETLKDINEAIDGYQFDMRTSPKACLESDIMITEGEISIESKGKGRQCFIKTAFALRKQRNTLEVLLLEEPENHLSHTYMRMLIERIRESQSKQLFIATHSSFIATRLNLQKVLILSEDRPSQPISLKDLKEDTAEFFMKAPDNNLLDLALAKKAILVEGDAEFILMDKLYKKCTEGISTEADCVHVISVDGTSFKRYLELAKLLGIRVAVIRDNDGDYQMNCIENYIEHSAPSIAIFADKDNARRTFEVCIYEDNKAACDALFQPSRKHLTVQDYMLKQKTDAAFMLLKANGTQLTVPEYIREAVAWIRK